MMILLCEGGNSLNKGKFILKSLGWVGLMLGGQIICTLFFIIKIIIEMGLNSDFDLDIYEKALTDVMPYILIAGIVPVFIAVIMNVLFIKNNQKTYLKKLTDYLNIHKIRTYDYLGYFCLGISFNIIISSILGLFITENNQQSVMIFSDNIFLSVLVIAFIVPLGEEIIFRNKVYWNMFNYSPEKANLIQALIFGLIHGNVIQFIYTTILGYIFCKINVNKKSLLPSIFMHCGLNFFACITVYSRPVFLYPVILLAIPTIVKLENKKEA